MARFAVHERGSVRHFELSDAAVSIGAGRGCGLVVNGSGVAEEHLAVERGRTGWHARRVAGSPAGLLVNDIAMEERRLRHGDRLQIGDVLLVFENVRPPDRDVAQVRPGGAAAAPGAPASAMVPAAAKSQSGGARSEDLARLRSTVRALASETDAKRLLLLVVDQVVALTRAERGFLVLRTEERQYEMVAARNLDGEDVQRPAVKISKAVAEEVARTGRPLLTTNAQADARLKESKSVEGMRLRSVLCLPLSGRDGFLGFLYLDHRFEEAAFHERDLPLLEAFADSAAVALENARLVTELRERTGELARSKARVEELNRLLEERVAKQSRELDEVRTLLRERVDTPLKYEYPAIIGRSPALREALRLVDHGADASVPILILGESGTGKELVARAIHANGPRAAKPFISENCAAIPETLLESALFGHVRGAFTGAESDRAGLFEQAHGGTLFLDEIGEIPLSMQVKLLRVLESGELRRVGGKDVLKVDVRIVSATNRDLAAMVEAGTFREDLYYRIHVLTIRLPPLRERREDIPDLVRHFLAEDAKATGSEARQISDEAVEILMGHPWPGNIRQLRNEILRAVALSGRVILPEVLSEDVRKRSVPAARLATVGARALKEIVQEAVDVVERRAVLEALLRTGWKKGLAAEMLQVSRPTLDAKIKRHGIRRAGGEIEE